MDRLLLRTVTCTGGPSVTCDRSAGQDGHDRCRRRSRLFSAFVLTVISFSAARRSRTPLSQLVADHLRAEPTLLAFLSDRYTSESSLRPFAPLADKLGSRMHVLVLAEWPQPERERDGEALLRALGVSREA